MNYVAILSVLSARARGGLGDGTGGGWARQVMAGLAVSVVLLSPAMAVPTAPRTSVSPEGPGDAAFLEARAAFTRGASAQTLGRVLAAALAP